MNAREQASVIKELTCQVIFEKFYGQEPAWVNLVSGRINREKSTDDAVRVESLFELDDLTIEPISYPYPKRTTFLSGTELMLRYRPEIPVRDPIFFSEIINWSVIHDYDSFKKEMDRMLTLTDMMRKRIKLGIFDNQSTISIPSLQSKMTDQEPRRRMVYPELGDYHHLTFEEFKAAVIAHLGDVYDESMVSGFSVMEGCFFFEHPIPNVFYQYDGYWSFGFKKRRGFALPKRTLEQAVAEEKLFYSGQKRIIGRFGWDLNPGRSISTD